MGQCIRYADKLGVIGLKVHSFSTFDRIKKYDNLHALAISVGLIPVASEKLTLCLCSTCADNFYGSGAYFLRRVNPASNEKELCTYCSQRMGVEYEITKRKGC